MIVLHSASAAENLTPHKMLGLQLILTVTAPASTTHPCKPCANYLKPKEIWAMIRDLRSVRITERPSRTIFAS
jgi:hypothetical protein